MTDKERNGEYMDNNGKEFKADVMLPCPFCGSEPNMTFKGNDYTKKRSVTIKCPKCRVQRTDAALRNNQEWCAKVCIEQWNTRDMEKSCNHSCSPSDYYKGGKCDRMGCYDK